MALSREEIDRHVEILNQSHESARVAASAVALAGTEDRNAIDVLAAVLGRADFLVRLDDTGDPVLEIANLASVFHTLATHPIAETGRLCAWVYASAEFRALPARINLLLGALAAVRPTTPDAAEVFRESSQEGYAAVNGPLLIKNESPLALQVFEAIISGDWVAPYVKVDILHHAVLPARTRLPILETCGRLLDRGLDPETRVGVIETVFDEQSRLWFGPAMSPPMAPPWDTAGSEALELLVRLADRLESDLEDRLKQAVGSTRREVEAILRRRRA